MFGRTVWSDDVLAETITDLIQYFKLSSVKTLGTEGGHNHKTLSEKIRHGQQNHTFQLCNSQTEYVNMYVLYFIMYFLKTKVSEESLQLRFYRGNTPCLEISG